MSTARNFCNHLLDRMYQLTIVAVVAPKELREDYWERVIRKLHSLEKRFEPHYGCDHIIGLAYFDRQPRNDEYLRISNQYFHRSLEKKPTPMSQYYAGISHFYLHEYEECLAEVVKVPPNAFGPIQVWRDLKTIKLGLACRLIVNGEVEPDEMDRFAAACLAMYRADEYGLASLDEICRALNTLILKNPQQAMICAPQVRDLVLKVDQAYIAKREGPFFQYLAEGVFS